MNRVFKELGFYSKKAIGLLGLLALLFLPLGFVVATWFTKISHHSKLSRCESENISVQADVTSFIEQLQTWARGYQDNNFTSFTDEILLVVPIKVESQRPTMTDFNEKLLNQLHLTRETLLTSLPPAMHELSLKMHLSSVNVAANQIEDISLWTFGFRTSEKDLLIVVTYPRHFLKSANSTLKCDTTVFNSSGQMLYENTPNNPHLKVEDLYKLALISPPNVATEALNMTMADDGEAQIRVAYNDIFIASVADSLDSLANFKHVFFTFIALGVLAFLITLIPLSKKWFIELQTAKLMAATIDSFTNGQFSARPRLFLNNHFSTLETNIDKLGFFLGELKTLGPSLAKSNLSTTQLKEYTKKPQVREVVALSLSLPALNHSAVSSSEMLGLYNEIIEIFSKVTLKNSGIIDFTTPLHFQSVWGLLAESEFDSANAGMTALELKMALTHINSRLISEKKKPLQFGIGLHRAPAQISLMGSEFTKALSVLGDPNYESYSLAKLALQTQIEILISEVMATLIEPYFVITVATDVPIRDVRVYTIQGYVDNQENPILIRSRKQLGQK